MYGQTCRNVCVHFGASPSIEFFEKKFHIFSLGSSVYRASSLYSPWLVINHCNGFKQQSKISLTIAHHRWAQWTIVEKSVLYLRLVLCLACSRSLHIIATYLPLKRFLLKSILFVMSQTTLTRPEYCFITFV